MEGFHPSLVANDLLGLLMVAAFCTEVSAEQGRLGHASEFLISLQACLVSSNLLNAECRLQLPMHLCLCTDIHSAADQSIAECLVVVLPEQATDGNAAFRETGLETTSMDISVMRNYKDMLLGKKVF